MKKLILLFIAVSLFSCKKEAVYGPLKLKNGQEVELLVDHRYGADQDILLTANTKKPAEAVLAGFENREPGYSYKVKARFHYEENPPADGSSYWYDFVSIVSKDQYKGDEPFTIQLIYHYGFGGPVIRLNKVDNDYYFTPEIQFTYADNHTGSQLAEIWANAQDMRNNHSQTIQEPKWKAIKATVKHDPQRFGKAYLVQSIQFTP
ncbi:DUF4377 domain-containing protein [Mucilaginibacter sp. UR6-1]|uniref:DUF4377 domain-containing protein n=1 Tax=Mucilaginibacter sp. UR6-1 TaxID=1435643 RepID=UPI001E37CCE0|nr:DUF4377 domain-containing protein [Mucilaginibacter sp. UR6-1]MCC8409953.1 DUF4377 domain-containing protein [Mucilaginibacter sp. UR6-1]